MRSHHIQKVLQQHQHASTTSDEQTSSSISGLIQNVGSPPTFNNNVVNHNRAPRQHSHIVQSRQGGQNQQQQKNHQNLSLQQQQVAAKHTNIASVQGGQGLQSSESSLILSPSQDLNRQQAHHQRSNQSRQPNIGDNRQLPSKQQVQMPQQRNKHHKQMYSHQGNQNQNQQNSNAYQQQQVDVESSSDLNSILPAPSPAMSQESLRAFIQAIQILEDCQHKNSLIPVTNHLRQVVHTQVQSQNSQALLEQQNGSDPKLEAQMKEFELNKRVDQVEAMYRSKQDELTRQVNQNELLIYQKLQVKEHYQQKMSQIEAFLSQLTTDQATAPFQNSNIQKNNQQTNNVYQAPQIQLTKDSMKDSNNPVIQFQHRPDDKYRNNQGPLNQAHNSNSYHPDNLDDCDSQSRQDLSSAQRQSQLKKLHRMVQDFTIQKQNDSDNSFKIPVEPKNPDDESVNEFDKGGFIQPDDQSYNRNKSSCLDKSKVSTTRSFFPDEMKNLSSQPPFYSPVGDHFDVVSPSVKMSLTLLERQLEMNQFEPQREDIEGGENEIPSINSCKKLPAHERGLFIGKRDVEIEDIMNISMDISDDKGNNGPNQETSDQKLVWEINNNKSGPFQCHKGGSVMKDILKKCKDTNEILNPAEETSEIDINNVDIYKQTELDYFKLPIKKPSQLEHDFNKNPQALNNYSVGSSSDLPHNRSVIGHSNNLQNTLNVQMNNTSDLFKYDDDLNPDHQLPPAKKLSEGVDVMQENEFPDLPAIQSSEGNVDQSQINTSQKLDFELINSMMPLVTIKVGNRKIQFPMLDLDKVQRINGIYPVFIPKICDPQPSKDLPHGISTYIDISVTSGPVSASSVDLITNNSKVLVDHYDPNGDLSQSEAQSSQDASKQDNPADIAISHIDITPTQSARPQPHNDPQLVLAAEQAANVEINQQKQDLYQLNFSDILPPVIEDKRQAMNKDQEESIQKQDSAVRINNTNQRPVSDKATDKNQGTAQKIKKDNFMRPIEQANLKSKDPACKTEQTEDGPPRIQLHSQNIIQKNVHRIKTVSEDARPTVASGATNQIKVTKKIIATRPKTCTNHGSIQHIATTTINSESQKNDDVSQPPSTQPKLSNKVPSTNTANSQEKPVKQFKKIQKMNLGKIIQNQQKLNNPTTQQLQPKVTNLVQTANNNNLQSDVVNLVQQVNNGKETNISSSVTRPHSHHQIDLQNAAVNNNQPRIKNTLLKVNNGTAFSSSMGSGDDIQFGSEQGEGSTSVVMKNQNNVNANQASSSNLQIAQIKGKQIAVSANVTRKQAKSTNPRQSAGSCLADRTSSKEARFPTDTNSQERQPQHQQDQNPLTQPMSQPIANKLKVNVKKIAKKPNPLMQNHALNLQQNPNTTVLTNTQQNPNGTSLLINQSSYTANQNTTHHQNNQSVIINHQARISVPQHNGLVNQGGSVGDDTTQSIVMGNSCFGIGKSNQKNNRIVNTSNVNATQVAVDESVFSNGQGNINGTLSGDQTTVMNSNHKVNITTKEKSVVKVRNQPIAASKRRVTPQAADEQTGQTQPNVTRIQVNTTKALNVNGSIDESMINHTAASVDQARIVSLQKANIKVVRANQQAAAANAGIAISQQQNAVVPQTHVQASGTTKDQSQRRASGTLKINVSRSHSKCASNAAAVAQNAANANNNNQQHRMNLSGATPGLLSAEQQPSEGCQVNSSVGNGTAKGIGIMGNVADLNSANDKMAQSTTQELKIKRIIKKQPNVHSPNTGEDTSNSQIYTNQNNNTKGSHEESIELQKQGGGKKLKMGSINPAKE